jgi:hypothetical protein
MTPRHAYDDPHAYHRRWDRLDPEAVQQAAERDPLLFIADHVPTANRRAGSVAVHVRSHDGSSMLILIADGPADPTDEECVACLATVVARIGEDRVAALGVVHHRPGRAHLVELDRRWQQALDDVCHFYEVDAVGVLVRTESGAIVRSMAPRSAPG